jgi:electron transfer flavoprotein-quinone oxidoreductase
MADDFDVIVVGAGMAGGSAAIRLAQGGANVLLLERGAEAGTKNLSGGVLWGHDLARILPNWASEMPVERHLIRKRFGLLTADSAASFDFDDVSWRMSPTPSSARGRTRGSRRRRRRRAPRSSPRSQSTA